VTPFGQFLVGHVIADLFQQVAGLARERDRKDEVVDPMYDEEWGVLAAALAQQLIDREMQCSDDRREAAEQFAPLEPEDVGEDAAVGQAGQLSASTERA
jgi:hypothetical protein